MCLYCDKGLLKTSNNFCGSGKLKISTDIDTSIELSGYKRQWYQVFEPVYYPRFKINYCPVCGKKLKVR